MGYKKAGDLYQKDNEWIGVVLGICVIIGLIFFFA